MNDGTPTFDRLQPLISAMLDERLTNEQAAELRRLLHENPLARRQYLRQVNTHAALRWVSSPPEVDIRGRGVTGTEDVEQKPEFGDEQSPAPPVIVLDPSPAIHTSLFSLDSPLGSFVFSYSVAAVLLGLGMLIGSVTYVTHYSPQIAETGLGLEEKQSPERSTRPVYVGLITGAVDVKWADPEKAPLTAYAVLGRQYDLASGLMEITYDTGAKVILQGPCTYEIESAAGGYLSLGKLTARIEKNKAANQKSNPQSLIPNPLFAVRTPTAVVTDLGTEFGVAVDPLKGTDVYVAVGTVELQPTGISGNVGKVTLGAGQSVRATRGGVIEKITPKTSEVARLKYRMPKHRTLGPVAMLGAKATFTQLVYGPYSAAYLLHDDARSWSIAEMRLPNDPARAQEAVFVAARPTGEGPTEFVFTIKHNSRYKKSCIGCFRLSVTTDPRPDFSPAFGGDGDWTPLEPSSAESTGGATLTIRDDASILVGGNLPDHPVYTIKMQTPVADITGFRIEAIKDPSLPHSGPGCDPSSGNFEMTYFGVVANALPKPSETDDSEEESNQGDQPASDAGVTKGRTFTERERRRSTTVA